MGAPICLGPRWAFAATAFRAWSTRKGYLWCVAILRVISNAKSERGGKSKLRVEIELTARQFGVPLGHLDTHMGTLLSRPDLLELHVNLGIEPKPAHHVHAPGTDPRLQARVSRALCVDGASNCSSALYRHHLPVLNERC